MSARTGLVTLLVALGAAVAPGQRIGPAWRLPDSLHDFSEPAFLAYSRSDGLAWVAGWDKRYLLAIDACTRQPVRRITVDHPTTGICPDPLRNRVYYTSGDAPGVYAVDVSTGLPVDSVSGARAGTFRPFLSGDAATLCVHDWSSDSIWTIDAATMVRRAAFPGPRYDHLLMSAPANKLYAGGWFDYRSNPSSRLCVIDCRTDSFAFIPLPDSLRPTHLCLDTAGNRLWVSAQNDTMQALLAFDCRADTLVFSVRINSGIEAIHWYSPANRIFCFAGDGIVVIDASTGQVIGTSEIEVCCVGWVVTNPVDRRCYQVDCSPSVSVLDSNAREVGRLTVPEYGDAACWLPDGNAALALCDDAGTLLYIAGDTLLGQAKGAWEANRLILDEAAGRSYVGYADTGVVAVVELPAGAAELVQVATPGRGSIAALALDAVYHRLYGATEQGEFTTFDTRTGSVAGRAILNGWPVAVVAAPDLGRAFCLTAYPHLVYSIDAESGVVRDSAAISTSPLALAYDPPAGRLFCATASGVTMLDARTGTGLGSADLDGFRELLIEPSLRRLWLRSRNAEGGSLVTIDTDSLRVINREPVPSDARLLACSAPLQQLYLECGTSVIVADALTGRRIDDVTAPWSIRQLATCEQGNALLVFGDDDQLARLDCRTLQFGGTLAGLDDIADVAVAADGTTVYALSANGTLTRIDLAAPILAAGSTATLPIVGRVLIHPGPDFALLYDVSGRRVLTLRPGANDISGLSPGTYLVAAGSLRPSRRIIVIR